MDVKRIEPNEVYTNVPLGQRLVLERDFDRVTAERDALQQLLSARDEEIDRLRGLLVAGKDHVEFSVEYWANNEKSDWDLVESIRAMESKP